MKKNKSTNIFNSSVFSSQNTNQDEDFVDREMRKAKGIVCALYKQPHCAQWNCCKLTCYEGTILPKKSDIA